MGEDAQSQMFFVVGFNFYGKKNWAKQRKWMNIAWEMVHNRVTTNVLNRMKNLSEWRIDNIQKNK
jgi:hypothetical protein